MLQKEEARVNRMKRKIKQRCEKKVQSLEEEGNKRIEAEAYFQEHYENYRKK